MLAIWEIETSNSKDSIQHEIYYPLGMRRSGARFPSWAPVEAILRPLIQKPRVVVMKLSHLVFCIASFGGVTTSTFNPTVRAATDQVWWVTPTLTTTTKYRPEDIAQTNSTGKKVWSASGSCKVKQEGATTFLFTSRTSGSCAIKLILKAHGKYPTRAFSRSLSVRIRVVNGHVIKPGVNLARKNLRDAFLTGANLTGADLRGADLRGADLRDANLTKAKLRGADLRDSQLPDANLTGADLTGVNMVMANSSGAIFVNAKLPGAKMRDVNLFGAILTGGVDLTGADLTYANLIGADLRGANLTGANLSDAALYGPSPTSGIMMGAMLEGANLSGANLFRTRPTDTQLLGTNLQGATMPTGTIHS